MRDFEKTFKTVKEHYEESLQYFWEDQIVGIFLHGSQNYGLDTEKSDVDTKLIVAPSFADIAMGKKMVSTTHVRANNEHIDFKDIRLYMQTFRKQNLNFLEILFSKCGLVNPLYQNEWKRLLDNREAIAHMNPYLAVKSMHGVAENKFAGMEKDTPAHHENILKFGYDPKELHHLLRVEDYIQQYVRGETYEKCLQPTFPDFLVDVKMGLYPLAEAQRAGTSAIKHIREIADKFCDKTENKTNPEVEKLLDSVQYNIMKIAVEHELELKKK